MFAHTDLFRCALRLPPMYQLWIGQLFEIKKYEEENVIYFIYYL